MSVLNLSSIHLLLLFSSLSRVDGYFGHFEMRCRFSSKDPRDIEFLLQVYGNKKLLGQYNSTTEKCTVYTQWMKNFTETACKGPAFLAEKREEMKKYCSSNVPVVYEYLLDKTVEPYIRLRSVELFSTRHLAMLVCSAYNFYPKPIRVTWLRDGQEVTSNVTSTEELVNGDWTYQIHSHLEYTPTPGERITCMVEHFSLTEPKLYDWNPSMPGPERNKMVIGACGVLLGVVFIAAGLIYYRKKSTEGRVLVPTMALPEGLLHWRRGKVAARNSQGPSMGIRIMAFKSRVYHRVANVIKSMSTSCASETLDL